MVIQRNQLVDISNAISDLTNRGVLEPAFRIFTPIVEDTRLLVDVVQLKGLQVAALAELDIFQSLDIYDQPIWLSLGNRLLEL